MEGLEMTMKHTRFFVSTAAVALLASLGLASAPAYAVETSCTPLNVIVFTNRVHIKCEESVGGISFFAASTADAAHVARVLSVISTATVAGRPVTVFYDPADTSGTAIGCAANDCRLIQAVGFWR
ncbi:MAG: hypothetical protein KJO98_14550 [Rhodothermia bacterium]|nr:hypothetical protein [Rhodothermia bacterium]